MPEVLARNNKRALAKAASKALYKLRPAGQAGLLDRPSTGDMACPAIREEGGWMNGIITIAEYLEWRQPEVAAKLARWVRRAKALAVPFAAWKLIMQERPFPGRAGLLSGEKAV